MQRHDSPALKLVDPGGWDDLLEHFRDANYRQLSAYAQAAAKRVGATSEYVAIYIGDDILGLCNVRIRKIPLLPIGIAYVNGGPVTGENACDQKTLRLCLLALRKEYVERRRMVLRVVGIARRDCKFDDLQRCYLDEDFQPSSAKGGYRTLIVDISPELVDIRRALDQKWRNILNKAERQELRVIRGSEESFFLQFESLFHGLVRRKNLIVDQDPAFFAKLQPSLSERNRFVVHLALLGDEVVAGHVGSFHGDTAVYLLGAASESGLKVNASYLLQWCVIEYAKSRGCLSYDLGGINPVTNPDVYRFKARMGGKEVCAPGPFEAGLPLVSSLVNLIEALYRKVRKLP